MYRSSSRRSRSYSPPPRSRSRPVSRRPDPRDRSPSISPPGQVPPTSPRVSRNGPGRSNRRSRAYPPADDGQSPHRRKREITIRYVFHTQLQNPWVRIFGFNRVKSIVPIAFSQSMVPIRTDPKDFPEARQLSHAYHHPDTIRPDHRWVDYIAQFDASDTRQNGLEFIEGLWAEKLGALAIALSLAIIIISIVWCVKGGVLQTVFTVMGFVLSFVAAEIALLALYYQIAQNNSPSSS